MTKEIDIEDMIDELEVLLVDPEHGLLVNTIKKDFFEEYKNFDLMIAWECLVEEINRVNSLVELHDYLVDHLDEIKKRLDTEDEELVNNRGCGTCKYYQTDGMFGTWCDKKHGLYSDEKCPGYERR